MPEVEVLGPHSGEKQCCTCGIWKPLTGFYYQRDQNADDGWCPKCKECRRKYREEQRNKEIAKKITKIETGLFETVTGLTVKDFHLLVGLKVFNTEQMNQAVFAFRRYEDASLRYTGLESHEGLTHYGLYDTVVARE
jgi:hypothetical protein